MAQLKYAALLVALAVGLTQAKLRVDKEWNGGFLGAFEIPVRSQVNNGWEIEIRFDRTASVDTWSGDLVSNSNDRVFKFRNKSWNGQLSSGSTLVFEFALNGGVAPGNIVSVLFNGQAVIGSASGSTTVAPATTKPAAGSTAAPAASSTAAPTASTQGPVVNGKYDYAGAIRASLLFYEAQRAGKLPANNRISWRGDSMMNDKGQNGEDLTGGYFDAGDFVKFGLPMAGFTTIMAWGAIDYEKAYIKAGELQNVRDAIRWSTDYFIKAHVKEREFYGQVGNGNDDHASWSRPEDWTKARPAWKVTPQNPGSDLVGETAAAFAAASIVFRTADPAYSATLLTRARQLYDFANENRGKYSDSIADAATFYNSWSGFGDELAWAAAWLLRATGEARYQTQVEKHYSEFGLDKRIGEFSWDNKVSGVQVLMAKITNQANYRQQAGEFCRFIRQDAPKTPAGLVYISPWGALRHAGNVAFLCMQAADNGINTAENVAFATKQIDYILGDTGRSFVVGFGKNPPVRPHHRSSSCPNRPATCDWNSYNSAQPNPQVLTGALVGGPNDKDSYNDARSDYIQNEVATDYNAGFQSATAGVLQRLL